jgi:hypothetical protein
MSNSVNPGGSEEPAPKLTAPANPSAPSKATNGATTANGGGDVLTEVTDLLAANPPTGWWVFFAFAILAGGTLGSYYLWRGVKPTDFMPSSDYAVYAGLFIMAMAIERVLEPFSGLFVPSTKVKKARSGAVAAHVAKVQTSNADAAKVAAVRHQAAVAKKETHRSQATRAVLMWATASVLAMLACASLGIFLLRSVETPASANSASATTAVLTASPSSGPGPAKNPNRVLDLLITGLVVGAGTKPLHDLITQIQTSSDNSKSKSSSASS